MTASDAFNLRDLVREVLRSSTMADPSDVANEVMKRIPAKMIKAALAQVLRDVVRQVMAAERPRNDTPAANPVPNRSWKREGVSDGWQKHLTDRIHVGPTSRDWKLLKFCTYDDLMFSAAERRKIAASNNAVADEHEAWARLINEHGIKEFGDLPAEAQMSALGRAA